MACRTICLDSCLKSRDGRCSDGWTGDEGLEGKPVCALGHDCADCGPREVCPVDGLPQVTLPRAVLTPASAASVLRPVQVLFMIMGSSRLRSRSDRAYGSWCRSQRGVRCLFVADEEPSQRAASANASMPLLSISAHVPKKCCVHTSRRKASFFCSSHRAATLTAQYRFLPALSHVQASAAFASGAFKWVVLVDDDTFVHVPRLLWLLARLDARAPIYAGDFGSSSDAAHNQVPHFACGGGGSVLSAAAVRLMDVSRCVRLYHGRCMQSDWMIGGCARLHNVSELRSLGCGTCDPKRIDVAGVRAKLREDRCFFLQNAKAFAKDLPACRRAAAIVHLLGLSASEQAALLQVGHEVGWRGG